VKCSGRRSTVEVPTLASLDRSLGTGGRPHQLPITAYVSSCCSLLGSRSRSRRVAHCLEAGLAVVVLLSAHCLEAGLAVVVLLTAWKQVLQSSSVEHWGTATPAAQKRSNTKCKGLRKGCRCLVTGLYSMKTLSTLTLSLCIQWCCVREVSSNSQNAEEAPRFHQGPQHQLGSSLLHYPPPPQRR
jgi:hypothetical protein